ncbi:NrtR DNA-binding winged helix domain-containing protein [Flavobacterium circumlabens]
MLCVELEKLNFRKKILPMNLLIKLDEKTKKCLSPGCTIR